MAYIPRMTPLYPPSRPLPISQVLDSAFRMFKVSFVRCLWFGPLIMIFGQLPNIYHLAIGRPRQAFGGSDPVWWVLYAVGSLGSIAISAGLCLHQRDIVTGVPTKALPKLLQGLRVLPAVIGLTVLILLIVGIPIGMFAAAIFASGASVSSPVVLIGGFLLILYFTFASVQFAFSWQALLFDRMSPFASLRYSFRLALGNWWRAAAVLTVAVIVVLVIYLVVATVAIPLAGATMDVAIVAAVTEVTIIALSALVAPYFYATMLALYGDLKARKEGTDLEQRIAASAHT
jgi:hypothetical protein